MPQSEVSTLSKPTRRTKEVDTWVTVAIPNNASGNFEAPTIGEFKVADESNVTTADITKRSASRALGSHFLLSTKPSDLKAWLTFGAVA
jgi:hypothetical protein